MGAALFHGLHYFMPSSHEIMQRSAAALFHRPHHFIAHLLRNQENFLRLGFYYHRLRHLPHAIPSVWSETHNKTDYSPTTRTQTSQTVKTALLLDTRVESMPTSALGESQIEKDVDVLLWKALVSCHDTRMHYHIYFRVTKWNWYVFLSSLLIINSNWHCHPIV